MVFSILNFLIKKLISEYSLEFGFTFLRFPRSFFCQPIHSLLLYSGSQCTKMRSEEQMSAFLPRLCRWTLLDSCWSLFGPCVWFSQSSETGQRVFLEKELTCPVSLPEALVGALLPPLPELVWQMPFHLAMMRMWICGCSLSTPE